MSKNSRTLVIQLLALLLMISMTVSLQERQHLLRKDSHEVDDKWAKWCLDQGGIVCGWLGKECCRSQCGVSTKFPWFIG
jgi:hypothetical protein